MGPKFLRTGAIKPGSAAQVAKSQPGRMNGQ